MRICSLDELSKKEVISCIDCARLGYITDVNIQLENAQIISVEVEQQNSSICLKRRTFTIPWECVRKIGDDIIIADFIIPNIIENDTKSHFLTRLFKN